jgi:hypothetical protein
MSLDETLKQLINLLYKRAVFETKPGKASQKDMNYEMLSCKACLDFSHVLTMP